MIDFSKVESFTIPEGVVTKIEYNGLVLWQIKENEVTYINMIPLSIRADGTDYVGDNGEDGYRTGYRLKSDYSEYLQSGKSVTGFIPITNYKDKIYIYNMGLAGSDTTGHTKIALYDSTFTPLGYSDIRGIYKNKDAQQIIDEGISFTDDGYLATFTPLALRWWLTTAVVSKTAYIRICSETITNNSIITINEPIV